MGWRAFKINQSINVNLWSFRWVWVTANIHKSPELLTMLWLRWCCLFFWFPFFLPVFKAFRNGSKPSNYHWSYCHSYVSQLLFFFIYIFISLANSKYLIIFSFLLLSLCYPIKSTRSLFFFFLSIKPLSRIRLLVVWVLWHISLLTFNSKSIFLWK